MQVNGITITQETIIYTRWHFAAIHCDCVSAVRRGEIRVNDPKSYIESELTAMRDCMAGKHDHTLTFMQCALWLQTGDCPGLLS